MNEHLYRVLAVAVAALALGRAGWAQHPTHPEGFAPEKAYAVGLIDNVDLFSGALGLSLPIGPLTLTYSSNVWTYETVNVVYTKASPNRKLNAGLGWRLSFGEVYHKNHWYNDAGRWLYVDESGGKHIFNSDLHSGEDDGNSLVFYSRDNTYMRFREISSTNVEIEFPDGTTRRYQKPAGGENNLLRLTRQWNRFGSFSNPDLTVTYSYDPDIWTVTDRYGRTHYVHFTYGSSSLDDAVTLVDLESYQGQRATYTFSYDTVSIWRSCKDTDPSSSMTVSVPLLRQINLPDGTSYKMKEGSTILYDTQCHGALDEAPGTLLGIILPTGGKFTWDYRLYTYPDPDPVWSDNTGVKSKTMKDRNNVVLGVWSYKNDADPPQGDQPEARTQVVYPTGDCTKHHFNARWWLSNGPKRGWEYGLPFAYSQPDNGHYLSEEVWSSSSNGNCAGTKLRSTYVKYTTDVLPAGTNEPQWWFNSNRRLVGTRTVFHDDGNRWTQTAYNQFDGLGHFREVKTTGNLWAGSTNNEERIVFTNYNRTTGTYPGTYVPVPTTTPWVLDVYDYTQVTENDALGQKVARVETSFEGANGFLSCERVLKSGSSRGANDVVRLFERDSLGRVTAFKTYGGDLQALATTGAGCGTLPSQPEYWVSHTYDVASGALKRSQPRQPNGTAWPYFAYDVDLDPSTGLVTTSRDPAGRATVYSYDALGRPIATTPPARATLAYTYAGSTSTARAKVVVRRTSGAQVLTDSEVHFDDFGRSWKERVKMPGGTWSEKETLYNARGWVVSTSILGNLTQKTQNLGYDPFGRATIIRPPNGASHDVRFTYQGIRRITQEAKIALPSGEAYVPRIRELDAYGRLRLVQEDSDNGTTLSTDYAYDVGGNLTRIRSGPSSGGVTQQRLFTYDNRGFLLSETHPEKGASGNGSVSYSDYNSIGKVGRRIDGPNDVGYSYDLLGRPLQVRDKGRSNRLLVDNQYDSTTGNAVGQLRYSGGYNWIDLPWNAGGEESVLVDHTYSYEASSGALQQDVAAVRFQGEADKSFVHLYQYDALGNTNQITYPSCSHGTCSATVGAGPTVTFGFDQGRLKNIPGWTGTLTYHPNGSLNTLPHANGVTDFRLVDPADSSRPQQLYTTGASQNWSSGTFTYDGAGNIKTLGANTFTYDRVERLVSGAVAGWSQAYVYDAFGNMKQKTTTNPSSQSTIVTFGVNAATNRLTAGIYSATGSMTSWAGTAYGYDALDRMTSLGSRWLYLYDADGERLATIDWTGSVSPRKINYTIRGQNNEVLSEFQQLGADVSGSWSRGRDRVYARGRLVGFQEGGARRHYHLDHLGSPRLITDANAATISAHHFLPYGEEVTAAGTDAMKFTGHERDLGTGLDYMHARYYNEALLRFSASDRARATAEDVQGHNRYAYVRGNPLSYLDPDGLRPKAALGVGDPEPPSGTVYDSVDVIGDFFRGANQSIHGFWGGDGVERALDERGIKKCQELQKGLTSMPAATWKGPTFDLAQLSFLMNPGLLAQVWDMGQQLANETGNTLIEFGRHGNITGNLIGWSPLERGQERNGRLDTRRIPGFDFFLHSHPDRAFSNIPGPGDALAASKLRYPVLFFAPGLGLGAVPFLGFDAAGQPIEGTQKQGSFFFSGAYRARLELFLSECAL